MGMGGVAKETEGVGSAIIQSAADRGEYCEATGASSTNARLVRIAPLNPDRRMRSRWRHVCQKSRSVDWSPPAASNFLRQNDLVTPRAAS